MYAHDPAGTRYSPLTQISPANVASLKLAWKYRFRSEKEITEPLVGFAFSQVTPIVVSGVMYLPSGKRVLALEPETGKEIWSYQMAEGRPSARGVSLPDSAGAGDRQGNLAV